MYVWLIILYFYVLNLYICIALTAFSYNLFIWSTYNGAQCTIFFWIQAYPKTKFGGQNRSFSSTYYKEFNWLEYSIKLNACFCYACRLFAVDSGHIEDTFKTAGFNNWKKVINSYYLFA